MDMVDDDDNNNTNSNTTNIHKPDTNALLRSVAAVQLGTGSSSNSRGGGGHHFSSRYDADYGEARTSISSPGRRFTLRERLRARARLQQRIQNARDSVLMEALEEEDGDDDDDDEDYEEQDPMGPRDRVTVNRNASSSNNHNNNNGDRSVRVKIVPATVERFAATTEPGEKRQQTNRIQLHVYDLIEKDTLMSLPPFGCVVEIGKCFADMNSALHAVGTGAYHVGVEINGVEYAYGATSIPNQTGVFTCFPRLSPGYQYRTTIDLGDRSLVRRSWVSVPATRVSQANSSNSVASSTTGSGINSAASDVSQAMTVYREVEEFIQGRTVMKEMALEYMGSDYDILRKNCCTFARDACIRLGVPDEEIPSWFRNLAESGAMTQDLAQATMEPITSVLSLACEDSMVGNSPSHARSALLQHSLVEATTTDQGIETIFQTSDQSRVLVVDDYARDIRRNSTWSY